MHIIPVILSGGSGSRLWPVSRKARPKQFLDLGMGTSLFRLALERCSSLETSFREDILNEVPASLFDPRPIIVSNFEYKYQIAEELLLAERKADVLLEPEGRNSCPAIAVACLKALDRDRDAVVLVAPSDQSIPDVAAFQKSVADGFSAVNDGNILIFGLTPRSPHPGFGYIAFDNTVGRPFPVTGFTEKPEVEIANRLVDEGQLWNAGLFLMRADAALEIICTHAPETIGLVKAAYESRQQHPSVAGGDLAVGEGNKSNLSDVERPSCFSKLDAEPFLNIEAVSFDCAVVEKSTRVKVLPVSYDWDDLGNWESVSKNFETDTANNRVHGSVNLKNSANNVVQSTDRLTALFGVENLIVVNTPDALLVADRERASEVNQLVDELKLAGVAQADEGNEHVSPWGSFMRLEEGEGYQVKRLKVLPGASLSLQAHQHRSEHWVIIKGKAEVVIDNVTSHLSPNDFIHIPVGSPHRLTNPGETTLVVIEVQTGDYFGEDDIVRFEDAYNRT